MRSDRIRPAPFPHSLLRLLGSLFVASLVATACVAPGAPGPPPTNAPPTTGPPTTTAPEFATLRPDVAIVNLRPRDTPFDGLEPWIDGIGYLRVWGGSRGMATYPTEASVPQFLKDSSNPNIYDVVSQDHIDGLLGLQADYGVRVIYMVNVNDTLASQADFVTRLIDEGIDLAMIELGNELYLPKFRTGDTTKLGVTRSWTPAEYVALLEDWVPALRERAPGVPVYGVGASHGTSNSGGDRYRRGWNEVISAALDDAPELIDGITFHQYAGEERDGVDHEEAISAANFEYLGTFGDLPIAVTESGYSFSEVTSANLDLAEEFWSAFRAALKPGDTYGVHVMFNRSDRPGGISYGLYDEFGRTAVGDRFASWLATWAATG